MESDEYNTVTLTADENFLIYALSVNVPDVEEAMTLIQRIIKALKEFFGKIGNLFNCGCC